MLLFTAFVCLVLGMGVPTTANYILVATLMAPVIVELGAQSGSGDFADRRAPVRFLLRDHGRHHAAGGTRQFRRCSDCEGRSDPSRHSGHGVRACARSCCRSSGSSIPALLLIDVHGWAEAALVGVMATIASLTFAAATLGWFRIEVPLVGESCFC